MKRRGFLQGAAGLAAVGAAGAWGWRRATGSMRDYESYGAALRAKLGPSPEARELVRYATLAPNGHNTQPWRFRLGENVIGIEPDLSRATPAVDPDDHHLYVSLGSAVETLGIAAAATGWPGTVEGAETGAPRYVYAAGAARPDVLFEAIPQRQSTRAPFDGREIPLPDLRGLETAAQVPGVGVTLLTERSQIARVRDLVLAGNDTQMADPAFMAELKHWLRFNPAEAMARGDGLFSASSGNPVLPSALGGVAYELFFKAETERESYARQMQTASGVAVFTGEREDKAHWIAVGQASLRFALAVTARGLRCSYVNQPVEVAALRPELAAIAGVTGKRPDLVMRFGYGPTLPFSPRRPVGSVLI
ncbi:Tat pathway signal protein [Salipiger sp. P9]|uniref:Acg family FMN-binding oxidoreductase n=1 Tax=Salipiger pentaromativorans TaxID=2943193 RepID=UPI00215883E3|nr:Tat pathway signal protein [Salipiger pentaromativorans]MCR8550104.1 Tat pathway signal protein [Salipiger pentaromativorans]